jgi:LPS-assembly protein
MKFGSQESVGHVMHLKRSPQEQALVETTALSVTADEIDYNDETGAAEARGHVRIEHFESGDIIYCDSAKYNLQMDSGTFYSVRGTAPFRIEARPGLLTTQNPFYFEGKWGEKIKGKYILHDGFLTDCIIPKPWWRLESKLFEVTPGQKAITRKSWFFLRGIPLFYFPVFYKSLEKEPRQSGFLAPHFVTSGRHGPMVGFGYYWAINRSYDLSYEGEYYFERGLASRATLRGDVNDRTSFDANVFGLRNGEQNGVFSPGGVILSGKFRSILGHGWEARGDLDYISSFAFRQEFSQTFHEAVFSETHSVGVLAGHWGDLGLNFVAQRNLSFNSTTAGDTIAVNKEPEAEFVTREHALWKLPLYVSFDSTSGVENRTQPQFNSSYVSRTNIVPRVSAPLHFAGINLLASFGIHETFYNSDFSSGQVTSENLLISARDFQADLMLPSLAKIFDAPSFLGLGKGARLKHVIEPRATYRYVTGVQDFSKILRFDETELLSNTHEVEFSLTNRLFSKSQDGAVRDVLSWQVWYKRYFDPTFGGALIPGQRNVLQSSIDLTGYNFLTSYRHQSPFVSALRVQSKVGIEWRADYDLLQHKIVNSGVSIDWRKDKLSISGGQNLLRSNPDLALNPYAPTSANQVRGSITYGNQNRKGWNVGYSAFYDYGRGYMQFSQAQATYNTDCCGFSVQYQRSGIINENRFRVSLAISNIGSFGNLKRQERIF